MALANLIYVGDSYTYSENLGKFIETIDGFARVLYSTKDANINSNIEIQVSRLSTKFRFEIYDTKFFSDWYDIKDFEYANINTYSNVFVDVNSNVNVEVQFKLISVDDTWDETTDYISVEAVSVAYTQGADTTIPEISIPSIITNKPIIMDAITPSYTSNFSYNPYEFEGHIRMNKDLAYMTNVMYGHDVEYIKVISNTYKGKDYILREYNLFNVGETDVKCLKVIVPDNQFPDNKPVFNMFGVDYSDVFEIQIVDEYFKQIFGQGYYPQEKDFLHFPLINRMYQVTSTYLFRGFAMTPLYWKLTLTKYEKKQNVIFDDQNIQDQLEASMTGLDKAFGLKVEEESKDIINTSQLKFNESKNDDIRSYISRSLKFTNFKIDNGLTVVSESQYNLGSLWKKYESLELAVSYNNGFKVIQNSGTTMTFWTRLEKVKTNSFVVVVSEDLGQYDFVLEAGVYPNYFRVNDIVSVYNRIGTDKEFLTHLKIVDISNDRTGLTAELISDDVFDYANANLISRTIERDVVVSGVKEWDNELFKNNLVIDEYSDRLRVWIGDSSTVNVEYFGTSWMFKTSESFVDDLDYAFVLSWNVKFQEFGLYVYKVSDDTNGKLTLLDTFTRTDIANVTKESNSLNLVSSPILLTNFRLVSQHIEARKHNSYLARPVIDNDSKSIVVDNAIDSISMEYVGKS